MSFLRIFLRLSIILGCALVVASVGAALQASRFTVKPQEFHSLAKISADVQVINHELKQKEIGQSSGTMAEILETAEMGRCAQERVKALHPDLAGHEVAIHATQAKDRGMDWGSGIITVHATGKEPKYTQIFLNALLDEFISSRWEVRQKSQGSVLHKVLNEAAALQKEMKEAEAALEKAREGTDSLSATSEHERLLTRLKAQQNQRDDLRLKIKTMAENDAGRAPLQTQLSAIEQEVQAIEARLNSDEAVASELRELTEKFATAKQAYDKKFKQAKELETSIDTDPESVAVMQRATPAFEIIEDWKLPTTVGAVSGALLGGIIGLMLCQVLVKSPTPPQIPTAVG